MQAAQIARRLHARRRGFAAARDGQEKGRGNGRSSARFSSKAAPATNKIPAAKANQIFDLLEKFAGYGFNKSHAAAYAIVAYQTAYLKANYPVEFFCAMMTNDMADTEKLSEYIAEAREFGIEVLQPDVNESGVFFAPAREGKAIRFGLAAIKNVGEAAVEAILKARNGKWKIQIAGRIMRARGWPFADAQNLGSPDQNRRVRFVLARRARRCSRRSNAHSRARRAFLSDKQKGQSSLFGALEEKAPPMPEAISNLPEWPQHELLAHEKELLGFYVTGHPLTPFVPILEKYTLTNTAKLAELPNRSLTRIGGLIAAVQHGISKKSRQAVFDGHARRFGRLGADSRA